MPRPATVADDTQSPAASKSVPHRWRGLALLTGTMVVDSDEAKLISTLFPMLRSALALPTAALGVLVAVGQLVGIVFGPFWTWLSRRVSRKTVPFLCSGLWGGWSIAAGFAQDFTQLLLFTGIAVVAFFGFQLDWGSIAIFWLLVAVMIANGLFCSLIYRPYVRDRAALDAELATRSARGA